MEHFQIAFLSSPSWAKFVFAFYIGGLEELKNVKKECFFLFKNHFFCLLEDIFHSNWVPHRKTFPDLPHLASYPLQIWVEISDTPRRERVRNFGMVDRPEHVRAEDHQGQLYKRWHFLRTHHSSLFSCLTAFFLVVCRFIPEIMFILQMKIAEVFFFLSFSI